MVAVFVNLRAAFDFVDRELLIEGMRHREVREELMDKCEDINKKDKE